MAKKERDQQKQVAAKHVTKRRLARWQKEKRRQRITFLAGVVVIAIVLGVIIGGAATSVSSNWISKVKTDSGTITLKKTDYTEELKLFHLYNASVSTNESPLLMIEENYLVKDKAKAAGLSASEAEIDEALLSSFGAANTSISDSNFQKAYQNALNQFKLSNKEVRDNIEFSLLSQKLIDYFVNQSPESGSQANVSMFTVSNISIANELAQKWRNGEGSDNLSKEYGSTIQSVLIVKGTIMSKDFDNVAFTIDIGNVSDPIPYDTGYYQVIKVLERTDGPVTTQTRQSIGQQTYINWLTQAQKDDVERNPKLNLDELYSWAVKELG